MSAPRLYIVTDRGATHGRPLVEVVERALQGAGARAPLVAVQLREKDLLAGPLLALARSLAAVTRSFGARLFVNDRLDVALAAAADGVHLGGGSLSVKDVRALTDRLAVAASTHEPADVAAAARDGADFVVLGPIFDTPSKRGLGAPLGPSAIAAARFDSIPILALGGVDQANAEECLRAGAHGVACIRAVMAADDPGRAARLFLDCFDRVRGPVRP